MSRPAPDIRLSPVWSAAVAMLFALVAAPSTVAAPRIEALRVERVEGRLLVSFDVEGAFTERALERLSAGLPLVFRHEVELTTRRSWPLWFPRVVARARVTNRVEYDSLARRYRLTRRLSLSRHHGTETATDGELEESTESLDRVRAFMGEIRQLPVLDLLGVPDLGELRLRVDSAVGRRYTMLFIPTAVRATATTRVDP